MKRRANDREIMREREMLDSMCRSKTTTTNCREKESRSFV